MRRLAPVVSIWYPTRFPRRPDDGPVRQPGVSAGRMNGVKRNYRLVDDESLRVARA